MPKTALLSLVVYNAGLRIRGKITELAADEIDAAWKVGAFGGFLVGQEAARRMLKVGSGTILFTGATASIKGFALSAGFAMAKFALRGLAQSMARELQPSGIHVAHVIIDGGIRSDAHRPEAGKEESMLDAAAIAESYLALTARNRLPGHTRSTCDRASNRFSSYRVSFGRRLGFRLKRLKLLMRFKPAAFCLLKFGDELGAQFCEVLRLLRAR